MLAAATFFGIGVHLWLRGRDRQMQRRVMTLLAVGLLISTTVFTIQRAMDPRFAFALTQNLPLHFCSMVPFMLIPAFWLGEGTWVGRLRALLFYPGIAGAVLAIMAPAAEYIGLPLFSMNSFFYLDHLGNVVLGALMVSLGFYRPTVRGSFGSLVSFFAVNMAVFPVTLALRAWVDPAANYFFNFNPEGSDIFVALWNVIPIPLVYQLPLLVLIIPILLLQYAIYRGLVAWSPFDRLSRMQPASMSATDTDQELAAAI
jgi:hypothetical protein